MKTTVVLLLAAWMIIPARDARAIQLSLEENRQETGHIGFIDMQRLFKQFPETIRAKENFEEVVRQAEEQVNIRKVEIIHLRNEISQLKIERKLIDQLPAAITSPTAAVIVSTPAAPAAVTVSLPAAPAPTVAMAPVAPPTKPAAHPVAALPGFSEASSDMPGESFGWKAGASTATAVTAQVAVAKAAAPAPAPKPEPLVINIPGVSTAAIVVQPPAAPTATIASSSKNVVAASTPAPAVSTGAAAAPAVPPTSASISAEKLASEIADMDAKIALKEKGLARKEEDFKHYQTEAEKNLLDLESRKTEILLGKIHRAIQDVARQEGVSVVVDKTSILFGHDAVDLTDKVLRYLKSS